MKKTALIVPLLTLSLLGSDAMAGISNTKHNLSLAGNVNRVTLGGPTNEVCVFCHTPHASETSAPAPLWNKRINTNTTYTTYSAINSSTIDGAMISVGSISLACLSCHDGTQAMDNIINAPGSQGYVADGGQTSGLAWTWNAAGGRVDTDGRLTSTNVANLSTDLKNDHPIGIQYCGGFTTGTNCKDADFKPVVVIGVAAQSDARYYVENSANSSRDKSDMILYTRSFSGIFGPSVECGSCHDPHVETKSTNEVAFLRVSQTLNDASGLCLACHIK